jgi:hypothetical protein
LKDKTKISPARWNYLAGLIDGDGSLGIAVHPHEQNYINYDATVEVATTHLPTVKWLSDTFGGQFYTTQDKRPNRKPNHHWYVSNSEHQLNLLKMVSPLLKLKRRQGETIVQFIGLGGRSYHNSDARKELSDYVSFRNGFFEPVKRMHRDVEEVTANKDDYQYLAGILDAEGTLSLYESKRSFDPKIQLPNTDMRVFDFLLEKFGGSVSSSKREHRELGNWVLPTRFLETTLLAILPYMVTKREQAILLLDWFRNRRNLSDDETREVIKKFRVLNHRGISLTTNTVACPDNGQMIESDLVGDCESAPTVMLVA